MFKSLLYAGNKAGRSFNKLSPMHQKWGAAALGVAGLYSLNKSRQAARRRAPITASLYAGAGVGLGLTAFHASRGRGGNFMKGLGMAGYSKISGRSFFPKKI